MTQNHTKWESFKCQRCGKCCTEIGLPFDSGQISQIAELFGITTNAVIQRFYGRLSEDGCSWTSERHKRTPCPFIMSLDSNKKACAIYHARPKACRQYPLDSDTESWRTNCPAVKTAQKTQ